jgi:hypothetical protein
MKAALFALSAGSLLTSVFGLHARHADFHKRDLPSGLDYGCCKTVVTVTVWDDGTYREASSSIEKTPF